jgi:hypothetical protein
MILPLLLLLEGGGYFNQKSHMKNILYFFFVLLTCTSCGCKKEEVPPEFVQMIFEIPLQITPIKDTVQVGDTLWLEASFPDTIRDHNSGKYYKVPPSFDLKSRIGFTKLINKDKNISEQPGFAQSYKLLNMAGGIENLQETSGIVKFIYDGSKYSLRVGIIPKQKAIASISFFTRWRTGGVYEDDADLSFLNLSNESSGGKRIPVLDNIYYIINEGNTNFDLFQRHCVAASLTYPIESNVFFEQKGTYTFVIE